MKVIANILENQVLVRIQPFLAAVLLIQSSVIVQNRKFY